jgi:signal transduction histidine kinase
MLNNLIENSVRNIEDRNQQRRARLLSIMLVGVAIITLFSTISVLVLEFFNILDEGINLYLATIGLFFSTFAIFYINRRGKVLLASTIFIILITIAISFADSPDELLAGRSLTFFIIPIMMASFLIRSYASFIAASMLTLEHLFLWNFSNVQADFSIFGMVGFFLFALITWLAARSLEQALDQARNINVRLDRMVGERTKELAEANAYLEVSNERLKELDVLKSKFVSDVSHELRTPISNISIYLEMLEDIIKKLGQSLPQKAVEFIDIARQETERLSRLINAILDSSRLEQSMANPDMVPVDVHELIQTVVEANRPNAEVKGLAFELTMTEGNPKVLADSAQLKQVFTNLVANAVNYTAEGKISLSTDIAGDWVKFIIQDSGMGIESDDIPHLFERFYRGQQASRSSIPGTGLGLAITKEIIELHQGEIEVQSEINVGTTFIINFPIHKEVA